MVSFLLHTATCLILNISQQPPRSGARGRRKQGSVLRRYGGLVESCTTQCRTENPGKLTTAVVIGGLAPQRRSTQDFHQLTSLHLRLARRHEGPTGMRHGTSTCVTCCPCFMGIRLSATFSSAYSTPNMHNIAHRATPQPSSPARESHEKGCVDASSPSKSAPSNRRYRLENMLPHVY